MYYIYNSHIPNIDVLNSDTRKMFLSILILNSHCVGVAIEGMDNWYMGINTSDISEIDCPREFTLNFTLCIEKRH